MSSKASYGMDEWKRAFLDKLSRAQTRWVNEFEDALDNRFVPVFNTFKQFLSDNGFRLSTPLRELGRRSFKFELAENAYLLMILRSTGVGEFELRCESFVPGHEPALNKLVTRVADLDTDWAEQHMRTALDTFVSLLVGQQQEEVTEEMAITV